MKISTASDFPTCTSYNPNLLLNLKFGVFRSKILSFPANQGTGVSTALGFPCTPTACVNYTNGESLVGSSGLTTMSISGSQWRRWVFVDRRYHVRSSRLLGH